MANQSATSIPPCQVPFQANSADLGTSQKEPRCVATCPECQGAGCLDCKPEMNEPTEADRAYAAAESRMA